jgi:two-component system sensor histidine kinase KdpD
MAETTYRRPTPDELLRQVEAEERIDKRGRLKIFLGYASGVGKSFRMFDEGRRRKLRGQDVVVAGTQPGAPPEVAELLLDLPVIPPRTDLGGMSVDVAGVLRRHPDVCLIDGLAYQNPPGSKNAQRWQDVDELLNAGISVVTSINLQYIREKQKQVEMIRGKSVKDSVPEAFIRTADEIELVDAEPEYCVTRSRETVMDSSQMERQLSELREIALVLAADVVDHQLETYLHAHGISQVYGTHERILVGVTPRSNASLMIQRGRRQADRFHGQLFVVYVEQDDLTAADQQVLDVNLATAREANAHVEILNGEDPVAVLLDFAKKHGITQIFVGHSRRKGLLNRWRANPVERLIAEAEGIDIRIFPQESQED